MSLVAKTLDALDLRCPLPLLKTKRAISELAVGECLLVLVSDPSSERDFRAWTNLSTHELVDVKRLDSEFHYLIRKG